MVALSREIRKLETKWQGNVGWPRRIEWLQIDGLRGWNGQRLDFGFPLMAVVGENGSGKSTVLQAAASIYRSEHGKKETYFPTEFFPDTPWDKISNAKITYSVREGKNSVSGHIHKPTDRWREVPERRKRDVRFIDLGRALPITSQVGYSKLAKLAKREAKRNQFDDGKLVRLQDILGREYVQASFCLSDVDEKRWTPVVSIRGANYSGFHQGCGELVLTEFLKNDIPKYSLVLIDELETSLHPRAQRRLIRDLAALCRTHELQIIVTTHSATILEELPPEGRVYIMNSPQEKRLITGVSPYFALTQMDEEPHPEVDVYVEDDESRVLLEEIVVAERKELSRRCFIIPYGVASVGRALGSMVRDKRFPRPTIVFLDGDQEATEGCHLLPGGDAPEHVVFEDLKKLGWRDVSPRVSRSSSDVIDALESAMTQANHHDWIRAAASQLLTGGTELWRALASTWAENCLQNADGMRIAESLQDTIDGLVGFSSVAKAASQRLLNARAAESQRLEAEASAVPPPPNEPLPNPGDEGKDLFADL
jgi:predicted ATPase